MFPMGELEILQRLCLAAAIGLLFGIERGWKQREMADGQRIAGIRTHTLIGLTGGVCGLLAARGGMLFLGLAFLGLAVGFTWFELSRLRRTGGFSATSLVTVLLTFSLAAYGAQGSMMATGAAAVLAALVLAERRFLHGLLRHITWLELRAALLLLVMTVVLLPVLPDRPFDPWGAVNMHEIWLMTVMIATVSFGGYVAMRLSGERRGLLYAGMLGGLVTSTTVTWTYARMARQHPGLRGEAAAAILAAWIVSLLRMSAIGIVIAAALAPTLLPPIAAAVMALLVPLALLFRWSRQSKGLALELKNPFELLEVLKLGLLIAVIMATTKLVSEWFGAAGVSALGAASGFLDVDPITLSMARMVQDGAAPALGVQVILLAALTNGIAKAFLGFVFGGPKLGAILAGSLVAAVVAGTCAFVLLNGP